MIALFLICFGISMYNPYLNRALTNTSEGISPEPSLAKGTPYKKAKFEVITNKEIEDYSIKMMSFRKNRKFEVLLRTASGIFNKLENVNRISYISVPRLDIKVGVTNKTSAKYLSNYVIQGKYLGVNSYFYGVFNDYSDLSSLNDFDYKKGKIKKPWIITHIYIKQNKDVLSYIVKKSKKTNNIKEFRNFTKSIEAKDIFLIGISSSTKPSFNLTILKLIEVIPKDYQGFSLFNQF